VLTEDPNVFFDLDGFAVEVTLSKADASKVIETRGIPEDAVMEEGNTGRASHREFQPQITVPTADVKGFGEDDLVKFIPKGEIEVKTFVILVEFPDDTQTTLTLEES
jgi:hypothetical protein